MLKELHRRPLVLAAMGVGVGLMVGLAWVNLLFLIPLAFVANDSRARWVILVGLLAGFLLAPRADFQPVDQPVYYAGEVDVISIPRASHEGYRFLVREGQRRLQASTPLRYDINLGDRIEVRGWIGPHSELSERYHLDQAVVGTIKIRTQPKVTQRGALFWRWATQVRDNVMAVLEEHLDAKRTALADALCFSETAELDSETEHDLSVSGLLHLVGSIGAKLFLVAGACFWLFSQLPIARWAVVFCTITVLLGYTAACGLTANGIRAFAMSSLFLISPFLKREFDSPSALAAVFLAQVLLWPRVIYDLGFQLSMVSLLGIGLYVQHLSSWLFRDGRLDLPHFLRHTVVISVVAWLFSMPIIAYQHGYVSLSTPVASLVAWIPFVAVFGCVLAMMVLVPWREGIASGFMNFALDGIARTNEIFGSDIFFVAVRPFSAYWLWLIYALALFAWKPKFRAV